VPDNRFVIFDRYSLCTLQLAANNALETAVVCDAREAVFLQLKRIPKAPAKCRLAVRSQSRKSGEMVEIEWVLDANLEDARAAAMRSYFPLVKVMPIL
jgi:hypothetical protein